MDEDQRIRDFLNHVYSIELRQALHVANSVGRVRNLPALLHKDQPDDIYNAILESWLVHARALCEFFLIHPSKSGNNRDFTAGALGWDLCHLDDYLTLDVWWVTASKYLLHFSNVRTPEDLFELTSEGIDSQTLANEGERFYMLALDFLEHLRINAHEDYEAWLVAFNQINN